jgi:hypothetical protein
MIKFRTILILVLITISICASAQSGRVQGQLKLVEGGTLQEAAKAAGGHFVGSVGPTSGFLSYQDLHQLAKYSKFIMIGTAVTNVCKLSEDERSIYTSYTFRIEEPLKGGEWKPGDTVTVNLPGGRVSFPDGSTAQLNIPSFRRMVNGNRYLLFLGGREKVQGLRPLGGPQGVFELRDDGSILAFANSFDPLSRETRRSSDQVIKELRIALEH